MQRHAILLQAFVVLGAAGLAAATDDVRAETPLDKAAGVLEKLVADGSVAGAQLVVGDRERILLDRSFGVRSLQAREPVDGETLFGIGSCSKMFAAATVLTLVAEGKLQLDTPIDRWLKEFAAPKVKGASGTTRAPTLRELLCHRGGIYSQKMRMTQTQRRWIRDFRLTLAESARGIAAQPLIASPGERFAYSGAGYCVLGRVAEVASGKPFDELLAERICKPLGLTATTFFPGPKRTNVAVGHSRQEKKLAPNGSSPHLLGEKHNLALVGGSIYCPAREAARFAQMMLGGGTFRGRTVLTKKAWTEMTSPQSKRESGAYGFGIGVTVDPESKKPVRLSHSGSLNGYHCLIRMDLRTGRFVVISYTGPSVKSRIDEAVGACLSAPPRATRNSDGE